MKPGARLLAILIRAYPPHFRERFARELLEVFGREWRRARDERGRMAALAFTTRTLTAALPGLAREWIAVVKRRPHGGGTTMGWIDALRTEARLTVRSLARSPGFAAVVALTLGLGVGANTAMFELTDQLLLRPPPFAAEADRLRVLQFGRVSGDSRFVTGSFSWPAYEAVAGSVSDFEIVAASAWRSQVAALDDRPRMVTLHGVSAAWWDLFDVPMTLGRRFGADEDRPDEPSRVAVLAHGFWTDRFGSDPEVLGREVEVGGVAYTVIGVTPRGFRGLGLRTPDLIVPLSAAAPGFIGEDYRTRSGTTWLSVTVRPAPGREAAALDAAVAALVAHEVGVRGEEAALALAIDGHYAPLQEGSSPVFRDRSRLAVWLLGTSWVVVLIACVNVATLMTGRALRRRRETAVRVALGQGRARTLLAPLLESLTIAALATLVAVPLGHTAVAALARTLVPDVAAALSGLSARALLYAGAMMLSAGALAAVIPALQARRTDPGRHLRAGDPDGRSRAQTALPVVQAALSAVLLVAAGLFVRSVWNAGALELGYDADRILVVNPETSGAFDAFGPAEESGFTLEALEAAALAVPGVERATRVSTVPFLHNSQTGLTLPDGTPAPDIGSYAQNTIHPGYFETMGTPIVRGRVIDEGDGAGGSPVMIVSETLARIVWPSGDALGSCAHVGNLDSPCLQVVGIAADIRRGELTDDVRLQIYLPWAQRPPGLRGAVVARTTGPARGLVEPVRRATQEVVPPSVLIEVEALEALVGDQRRSWLVGARVFSAFGLLALGMAVVGLFSVVAYDVTRRKREFAIRAAVGAGTDDLIRLVVRKGVLMTAGGVTAGLVIAAFLSDRLEGLLFAVGTRDPVTFAVVGILLLAASLVASLAPALRAGRVEPARVLEAD